MNRSTITPQELHEIVASGRPIDLIDVRTQVEFREVHVDFARNVPLDQLDAARLATDVNGGGPLYVICRSGNRSRQAAQRLEAAGIRGVVNVEGGTQAWDRAGLPVVRGQKSISLERQVRIMAGTLVVIGAVLGILVHPYWVLLSAVMGAGLVFAGITDSCAMGMFLGRMPWNRVAAPPADVSQSTPSETPTCCG